MASKSEFETAIRRAVTAVAAVPRALSVRYDRENGRVEIHLSSGLVVSFSPRDAQGLEQARPSELEQIEISPSGFGIHFPKLDADLYLPSLLEGFFGSRKWMGARLGQVGGQSRSRAKKVASRANGRLGGRPRKKVAR